MSDDPQKPAPGLTRRRGRRPLGAPSEPPTAGSSARDSAQDAEVRHPREPEAPHLPTNVAVPAPQPQAVDPNAATSLAPDGVPRRRRRRAITSAPPPSPERDVLLNDAEREPPSTTPARRSRWRLFFLWVAGGLVLSSLAAAASVYFVLEHYSRDLPSVETLKAGYDPPQISRFLARDETLLVSVFTERRTVVPFDVIPKSAKLAFLAAEDASFYEHEGLDYLGMLRALWINLRAGKTVQGGSTITQQVVKNVLLDSSRSYERKIRETLLALRMEQSLTKHEIFWLYLNHIYLGHGRYGIEEAARYYFGKHASALTLDEASVLAGLVAAPERYTPRRAPERALARRRFVLDQMLRKGFVTPQLHESVRERPLRLAPAEESESRLAPEIVQFTTTRLRRDNAEDVLKGGHTLRTSIDPRLQAAARAAVRDNLDAYMERHKLQAPLTKENGKFWGEPFSGEPRLHGIYTGTVVATDDHTGTLDVQVGDLMGRVTLSAESRYNPKHLAPSKFAEIGAPLRVRLEHKGDEAAKATLRLELGPQSALVAIDVRSREVLALVGSYEAIPGGLDRATQAKRQPGSTFKPLLYSYGLHSRRFTPATMLDVSKGGTGVEQVGDEFKISFRQALAQSHNEASVSILRQSGPEQVVQWAHALGVESEMQPDLSLALGSYELSPLELANAYATLASGGMFAEPITLLGVSGPDGTPLSVGAYPPPRRVLTEAEAYLTTSLMRSVVREGTGQAAAKLGRDLAGKTGTTNDSKDAWFAGFSTDVVVVVWVGYDDARSLGKRESGARTALPAWIQFMEAAHQDRPKTEFRRPGEILQLRVDRLSGLLPNSGDGPTQLEEFLSGTEPSEVAPLDVDAGVPQPSLGVETPEPVPDLLPEPPPF